MAALTRRKLLNATASLLGGVAAAAVRPIGSFAQDGGPRNELDRLLGARGFHLQGGAVLTLDRVVGDFERADVLIENGRIREVRPGITVTDDSIAAMDASDRIIIPGFVDTHSHSFEGILRGSLPNGTIFDPGYRETFEDKLTAAFAPEDVYAGVLMTALGMIETGTTAMVDTSQINHSPEHSDALVRALQEAGIRAVCAYGRGRGPRSRYPQDVLRLRQTYFSSGDQLLSLAFATSIDPKTFAFVRENDLRSVLHIRLNSDAIVALARGGWLRAGDEYVHCLHLNDEAWRAIKENGGRTSHSPPLEMAMGHGRPSMQDALDHGLRPSLSSDHGKIVGQDMFGMMRTVFELQRLAILQRSLAGERNLPALVTPRDVLEFATIEGARCADLDAKIGTLTPGKEADLLVLRADSLDILPRSNLYGTVANLMNPGHVESVFIGGHIRKWRGNLVGVDRARVRRLAQQSRDAVMQRADFRIGPFD